ncbi:MAG TPA: DUF5615 family PIN-like protein [Fimbriimonadaceae bacterium]|nr:DUF5615 family PIN-like protein [Fimbriimonadaceae bacterium]
MKLLADEGVDRLIVERLRADGHEVLYVAEMKPGIADDEVLELAQLSGAVLVTQDKDFGDLVVRQGRVSAGVLLLRLAGSPPEQKAQLVSETLAERAAELASAFAVLTDQSLRVRRIP